MDRIGSWCRMSACLGCLAAALGVNAAVPATRPATQPALSDPRAVAIAYVDADSYEAIRAVTTGSEDAYRVVKASIEATPALWRLAEAVEKRFGYNSHRVTWAWKRPDSMKADDRKRYAQGPVRVTGDKVIVGDNSGFVTLKKVNGEWRVPLDEMRPEDFAGEIARHRAEATVADQLIAEIRAGKYATDEDVEEEFDFRSFRLATTGSTRPASAPSFLEP